MDDLSCIKAASEEGVIPKGTTVPSNYSDEEGRAFVERQWSRQTSGRGLSLAVADAGSDEAVGLVFLGLGPAVGHCELGYWLIPDARGRGLGSAAVRLVSRWLLTQTDVYRLYAHVDPVNQPSLALLDRCGFQREGLLRSHLKFGDHTSDAVLLSLLRSDVLHNGSASR